MARTPAPLTLSRTQILQFRRQVGALDARLPAGSASVHTAAWAGLQDSMPRAALLSIHARVKGATSTSCEHPSLVQLWGPRFSDYVVAAKDLAVSRSDGRRIMDVAAPAHTTPPRGCTRTSTAAACRSAPPATRWG